MRHSYQHTPAGGGSLATGEGQKYWKTSGRLSAYPSRRRFTCHWGRPKVLENLRKTDATEPHKTREFYKRDDTEPHKTRASYKTDGTEPHKTRAFYKTDGTKPHKTRAFYKTDGREPHKTRAFYKTENEGFQ